MKFNNLIKNIRIAFLTGCISLISFASCMDDGLDLEMQDQQFTRALQTIDSPGGLVQQADGTWKTQNCRVPLVGPGRIINEINNSTVQVGAVGSGAVENITDINISNVCEIPAAVNVNLAYTPLVSVKDMYHIYAAGQKVGFIYKEAGDGGSGSLLTLDLLKGMTLTTYLKGNEQENVYAGNETSGLGLDLISFNTGGKIADREISFDTSKPFDEVRLSITGVNISAATNLSLGIKYAFVGENPEIRATSEPAFSYFWTGGNPGIHSGTTNWTNVANSGNIVDSDIENSSPFTSQLGIASMATVDFKKTIPVGTEIGYCYDVTNILGLDLFGQDTPTLISYYSNDSRAEESTPNTSLLGISVIGISNKTYINMITEKECSQLKFQHPRSLINVGGMNVYYAYVREGTKLDPVNYFTCGDDETYNYSYRLPQPKNGGNVQYFIVSEPYGTSPSIKDGHILTGMSKDGAYRIQAVYTAPDGRQFSQVFTITHLSENELANCNIFITAKSHGAYAVEALGSQGCLLCLFSGNNDLNNVVDDNPDNYATSGKLANVAGSQPVAAFKMNVPVEPINGKSRVGFVVQANSKLLDLSALNSYTIRLYDGENKVQSDVNFESVKLGLLGFDQSKMRISVETDKRFDRIELWREGLADVLTSLRIYNLFQEPVSCEESFMGGACMEIMSNMKDNLQVNYSETKIEGVLSAGGNFGNLSNMLDGNHKTGGTFGSALNLGTSTKISYTFDKKPANQKVGIILYDPNGFVNVSLVNVGILEIYNGDQLVASTRGENTDILGVSLLSQTDYSYIEIMSPQEFDRIDYTVGDGLGAGSYMQIRGVYYRPDSDGDGIPDCADTDDPTMDIEPDGDEFHTCYGNELRIPLKNSTIDTDINVYAFHSGLQENLECKGRINGNMLTIPAKALRVGEYQLYIYSDDKLLAYDIDATVHPVLATWKTNNNSTDWNDWDNWVEGSPWSCTDVIIPSNANLYPELKSGEKNYCKNIHFEQGGEVVGLEHLTMSGLAFVDMTLQGGSYYLVSAPLQETFSGDMFISPNVTWGKDKYFTVLNSNNYKESRNRPIVYQYVWNGRAIEKDESLSGTNVGGSAAWSSDFNNVKKRYWPGQGFLLRAGASTDKNTYTFRFPKNHTSYSYYTSTGSLTGAREDIPRRSTAVGKFAMTSPGKVTLRNSVGSKIFLMGNPFMSHINVAKLKAGNPNIKEIKVAKNRKYDPNQPMDGQTISSNSNNSLFIAPMEAFFIIVENDATSAEINITSDMLTQKRSTH